MKKLKTISVARPGFEFRPAQVRISPGAGANRPARVRIAWPGFETPGLGSSRPARVQISARGLPTVWSEGRQITL